MDMLARVYMVITLALLLTAVGCATVDETDAPIEATVAAELTWVSSTAVPQITATPTSPSSEKFLHVSAGGHPRIARL